jgi:hypothetical protein
MKIEIIFPAVFSALMIITALLIFLDRKYPIVSYNIAVNVTDVYSKTHKETYYVTIKTRFKSLCLSKAKKEVKKIQTSSYMEIHTILNDL